MPLLLNFVKIKYNKAPKVYKYGYEWNSVGYQNTFVKFKCKNIKMSACPEKK